MCVAIYKPENIQTPSLDTLKKCWEANPDGAGFALFTGGDKYAIEIHKGYMTWKQFVTAYKKYLADFQLARRCKIVEAYQRIDQLRPDS